MRYAWVSFAIVALWTSSIILIMSDKLANPNNFYIFLVLTTVADYTLELLKLLNNMPIAPFAEIHKIFMEDIGETAGKFFKSFDESPIGSASMAQVYEAVLKNGEKVAVKIRRPGIEKVFEADFLVISFLATIIDVFNLVSSLSLKEVADDFIRWTKRELDFRHESNNAAAFLEYSQE